MKNPEYVANFKEELGIRSVKIDGLLVEIVDAQRLHAYLGIKSRYHNWIMRKIKAFSLREGYEYDPIPAINKTGRKAANIGLRFDAAAVVTASCESPKSRKLVAKLLSYRIDEEKRRAEAAEGGPRAVNFRNHDLYSEFKEIFDRSLNFANGRYPECEIMSLVNHEFKATYERDFLKETGMEHFKANRVLSVKKAMEKLGVSDLHIGQWAISLAAMGVIEYAPQTEKKACNPRFWKFTDRYAPYVIKEGLKNEVAFFPEFVDFVSELS